MITSAVDLVRRSGDVYQRGEKPSAAPRSEPTAQAGDRDPDQGGALLRFAKFVNKEKKQQKDKEKKKTLALVKSTKPVSKSGAHPYASSFEAVANEEARGQVLNIYV